MSAPTAKSLAPGDAQEAAEALTLLDALARAPAAAALVVAALNKEDRRALRLVHSQLRDAVGEATTKLVVDFEDAAAAARPPTPARWPRLETLRVWSFNLAALEALGAETWADLRVLGLYNSDRTALDAPAARALVAALRQMPALRTLELCDALLTEAEAAELLCAAGSQLRVLTLYGVGLAPAAARALAATGWRLEKLDLSASSKLGTGGLAAFLAAPTFAIRRLNLAGCGLDAASLLALADTSWPLEELDLSENDFSAAAAGPALAALSQRCVGLRKLHMNECLTAAGFKALVEAAWPALTFLFAQRAKVNFDGPLALGAAAFAGFPALEELCLPLVELGAAGAALLARRRWARLRRLNLVGTQLSDSGLAALARGAWPALARLDMRQNRLRAPPTLEAARRWAPALEELYWNDYTSSEGSEGSDGAQSDGDASEGEQGL